MRLSPYVNAYNPWIHSYALRCNGDIKLVPFGSDTKNIAAYIVNYATKKQGRTFNVSALLAKIMKTSKTTLTPQAQNGANSLLIKLANAMNSRQEIGAPMAVATLMGWAPCIASHTPKRINLYDVHRVLEGKIFCGLHPIRCVVFTFCHNFFC